MTEAKHTPGPWSVFNDPKSNYGLQVNANNAIKAKKVICRVGGPDRDANARLLSAAPDMLEALKLFLACDEGADLFGLTDKDGGAPGECAPFQSEELERAIDLASAAIAKATGG